MGIQALFKILIIFSGIVILYRLKAPLWASLLLMSGISGLWFNAGIVETLKIAARSSISAETRFLIAVVVLILGFSNLMDGTGVLKKIVESFSRLLGKSMYSGAALPALIGLLPMPGGAIFSAPMVDTACGAGSGQNPEQKSAINYWFRHVWEYWWPLYPGVILASHLFHASMWKIILFNIPLTLAAVASGYLFILKPAFAAKNNDEDKQNIENNDNNRSYYLFKTIRESASIIIVIVTIFAAGPVIGFLSTHLQIDMSDLAGKYWPVIMGVIFGIVWLAATQKTGVGTIAEYFLSKNQLSMVLLVVGIMLFRDMLTGVDAFSAAKADLELYNIPPLVVIAALPFISGIVMGIAVGFVGASFPLVISLLPASVMESDVKFAYLALAYSFGYMGMMLSPVHFCLILTKDYFKANLGGIYRLLIIPAFMMLVAGLLLFAVYSRI